MAAQRPIGLNVQVSDLAPDYGNSPFQVIAPTRVASVVVNDGSAQRSMVNSLTVTFDRAVTLDPGAFELSPAGRQPGRAERRHVRWWAARPSRSSPSPGRTSSAARWRTATTP